MATMNTQTSRHINNESRVHHSTHSRMIDPTIRLEQPKQMRSHSQHNRQISVDEFIQENGDQRNPGGERRGGEQKYQSATYPPQAGQSRPTSRHNIQNKNHIPRPGAQPTQVSQNQQRSSERLTMAPRERRDQPAPQNWHQAQNTSMARAQNHAAPRRQDSRAQADTHPAPNPTRGYQHNVLPGSAPSHGRHIQSSAPENLSQRQDHSASITRSQGTHNTLEQRNIYQPGTPPVHGGRHLPPVPENVNQGPRSPVTRGHHLQTSLGDRNMSRQVERPPHYGWEHPAGGNMSQGQPRPGDRNMSRQVERPPHYGWEHPAEGNMNQDQPRPGDRNMNGQLERPPHHEWEHPPGGNMNQGQPRPGDRNMSGQVERLPHHEWQHRVGGNLNQGQPRPGDQTTSGQVERPQHQEWEHPAERNTNRGPASLVSDPSLVSDQAVKALQRTLVSDPSLVSDQAVKALQRNVAPDAAHSTSASAFHAPRQNSEVINVEALHPSSGPREHSGHIGGEGQGQAHHIQPEKLNWNSDTNNKGQSDLAIKVVRQNSGKTDVYNVHSKVLTDGPRASKYFQGFVQNLDEKRVQSSMICLELPDMSADVFPAILDYVYGSDNVPAVQRKSEAFAAYDLAQYLEIPQLMEAVAEWFRPKVRVPRVIDFLDQVEKFKNNARPLIMVAVELCARNFDGLGAEVGGQLGADILLLVLERVWEMNYVFNLRTDYVTDIILECTHEGKIDREMFYQLTDRRFLPVLEPRSALKLLIVDDDFNDDGGNRRHLTCLQRRCVRSLVHHWKSLCSEFESPETMTDILSCLSSPVLAAIVVGNSKF